MAVNWGIMAQTGQDIGRFGDFAANWLADRRAKAEAIDFLRNNPSLFGQQPPQTLGNLGQPMPAQQEPSPFMPAPPDGNAQTSILDRAANAITKIESGGRYDALGPVTKSGDRAYGRYQVMGANVPAWTRQYLGREMTPQEFAASPEAQDAVFKGEFGRLSQKHGPEGAARAWFAGEGGMNDPNRRDILGTSVADYGQKFSASFGAAPQAPAQPLSNVAPMRAPAQAPVTLAQLGQPQGMQMSPEQLGAMMTNRYLAPIAQQLVTRQLGRDPLEQQQRMLQIQQLQQQLQGGNPFQQAQAQEQLRQLQLSNRAAEQSLTSGNTKDIPNEIREYNFARQQGFTGSFLDFQQAKTAAKQKPGLSAADKKVIYQEEDKLPQIDNTIGTLQRALELNNKTYTGFGAGQLGTIASTLGIGGEAAMATREFNQIMGMEAIKTMSETLKGASTDREMAEFQSKMADPTTPPDIRDRLIRRMLTLAERQKQLAVGRINELRGNSGSDTQAPVNRPSGTTSSGLKWSVE